MKIVLFLLVFLSVGWLMFFVEGPHVIAHAALDGILPPRVLESATPGERLEMAAALEKLITQRRGAWIAPATVLALSLTGLIIGFRRGLGRKRVSFASTRKGFTSHPKC